MWICFYTMSEKVVGEVKLIDFYKQLESMNIILISG